MFNAVKLLAFVGLLCVVAADVERVSSWGNIAGDRFSNLQVYSRLKSKSSLPWLTREGDVQFPDVSSSTPFKNEKKIIRNSYLFS